VAHQQRRSRCEEEAMKVEEVRVFGVKATIFENGDVYITTDGDIHVLDCKHLFTEKEVRKKQ